MAEVAAALSRGVVAEASAAPEEAPPQVSLGEGFWEVDRLLAEPAELEDAPASVGLALWEVVVPVAAEPEVGALQVRRAVVRWPRRREASPEPLRGSPGAGLPLLEERVLGKAEVPERVPLGALVLECLAVLGGRASARVRKSGTRATDPTTLSRMRRPGRQRTTGASPRRSNSSGNG